MFSLVFCDEDEKAMALEEGSSFASASVLANPFSSIVSSVSTCAFMVDPLLICLAILTDQSKTHNK